MSNGFLHYTVLTHLLFTQGNSSPTPHPRPDYLQVQNEHILLTKQQSCFHQQQKRISTVQVQQLTTIFGFTTTVLEGEKKYTYIFRTYTSTEI